MKAYKITEEEKNAIEGEKFGSMFYRPMQDVNNDWFIFGAEHEACGLGVETEFTKPPETPLQ